MSVPSAFGGAARIIQARMVGAIAHVYGHNIRNDRVRTGVLMCLAGNSVKEALKEAGIVISSKVTTGLLSRIPGRVLMEVNRKVGFRLLTKAETTGAVNLSRMIPDVGGAIGGTFDAVACRAVGRFAESSFAVAVEISDRP